jgi:hypothetical protein
MPCEIGQLVYRIMFEDLRPRERMRLRRRLSFLCSYESPCEVELNPRTAEPKPIPYEIEMGL